MKIWGRLQLSHSDGRRRTGRLACLTLTPTHTYPGCLPVHYRRVLHTVYGSAQTYVEGMCLTRVHVFFPSCHYCVYVKAFSLSLQNRFRAGSWPHIRLVLVSLSILQCCLPKSFNCIKTQTAAASGFVTHCWNKWMFSSQNGNSSRSRLLLLDFVFLFV